MMALYKLCLVICTYFPHTIATKGVTRCIEVYKSPPLSSLLPCDFFPVFEILQTHVDTTVTDLFFCRRRVYRWIDSKVIDVCCHGKSLLRWWANLAIFQERVDVKSFNLHFLSAWSKSIDCALSAFMWQRNHGVITSFDSVNSNFKKPCYM